MTENNNVLANLVDKDGLNSEKHSAGIKELNDLKMIFYNRCKVDEEVILEGYPELGKSIRNFLEGNMTNKVLWMRSVGFITNQEAGDFFAECLVYIDGLIKKAEKVEKCKDVDIEIGFAD